MTVWDRLALALLAALFIALVASFLALVWTFFFQGMEP